MDAVIAISPKIREPDCSLFFDWWQKARAFATRLAGLNQIHLFSSFPEFAAEIRMGNADQCFGPLFG